MLATMDSFTINLSAFLRVNPLKATGSEGSRDRVRSAGKLISKLGDPKPKNQYPPRLPHLQLALPLDPRLSEPQTSISESMLQHLLMNNSQYWCVLGPLLYSLYTHECTAKFSSNSICSGPNHEQCRDREQEGDRELSGMMSGQ